MESPVLSVSKLPLQSASEIADMITATLLPPRDIWSCYVVAVKVIIIIIIIAVVCSPLVTTKDETDSVVFNSCDAISCNKTRRHNVQQYLHGRVTVTADSI